MREDHAFRAELMSRVPEFGLALDPPMRDIADHFEGHWDDLPDEWTEALPPEYSHDRMKAIIERYRGADSLFRDVYARSV